MRDILMSMPSARVAVGFLLAGLLLTSAVTGCGRTRSVGKAAGLIAFSRQNRSTLDQIYVVRPDGSGEHALTTAQANDYSPVWSPDGKKLAFLNADESLFVMNADGSGKRLVTRGGGPLGGADRPSWSPDGRRLVFQVDLFPGHAFYIVNLDGRGMRKLPGGGGTDPAWSPDGKTIAFSDARAQIALINATGGGFRELTDHGACNESPTWSPDSKRIAYTFTVGSDCAGGSSEIDVMNADGSDQHALTHTAAGLYDQSPAWSPDGKMIAFLRGGVAFGDIYAIRLADAHLRRLTRTHAHKDFGPSWQPLPRK